MEDFPPLPYPQMPGNDYTAEDMRNYVLADRRQRAALLAERDALREALDELVNGYAGNRWDIGLVQRLKKARAALAQEEA